jgi:alkanesulfonate monooxygenase SsuD/methylene tetrahydromethanopterin reductase-like flavin-dependent oxidoreductase (luciferase family)
MARHPWVAKADDGVRFGVQVGAIRRRTALFRWELRDEPMRILMEAGRLIESLGFDGLFIHDHPMLSPDPWICLPALAAVTERVMLGSVVNCVYYRHPAHLARLATDLDQLSHGRMMLGIGSGWSKPEFMAFDKPFRTNVERLIGVEETAKILEGVWGPEPFKFEGEHFKTQNMRLSPGPVQQPRPPIMIAGTGEKVTLRQVAQYADACNLDESKLDDAPHSIPKKIDALRRHCETLGRDDGEILRTHFVGWLMLAPTEAAVAEKVARYFPDGVPPAFDNFIMPGTPEQITEWYQARADAGIQYFVVQMLDGTDHETLELLAKEVAPNVH